MLDEFLIRHSAPTLAGLKTANLFWYPWENREELKAVLEEWQKVFQEKGLGLMVMRLHGQGLFCMYIESAALSRI